MAWDDHYTIGRLRVEKERAEARAARALEVADRLAGLLRLIHRVTPLPPGTAATVDRALADLDDAKAWDGAPPVKPLLHRTRGRGATP